MIDHPTNLTDAWVRLVEDCRLKRYQRHVVDPKTGMVKAGEASESLDLSAHVASNLTSVQGNYDKDGGNERLQSMIAAEIAARMPLPYTQRAVSRRYDRKARPVPPREVLPGAYVNIRYAAERGVILMEAVQVVREPRQDSPFEPSPDDGHL